MLSFAILLIFLFIFICSDERHHRDLSFCLGQLPLTDRSIVNLHTHLESYIHAIAHDAVYDNMKAIFAKFRVNKGVMADDTKLLLDEMESKMKVQREKGIAGRKNSEEENGDAGEGGNAPATADDGDRSDFEAPPPPPPTTGRRGRGRPGRKVVEEAIVSSRSRRGAAVQSKKAVREPPPPVMPSTRSTRSRNSSATAAAAAKPALNSRAARVRRVIESESSEDDNDDDTYDFDE